MIAGGEAQYVAAAAAGNAIAAAAAAAGAAGHAGSGGQQGHQVTARIGTIVAGGVAAGGAGAGAGAVVGRVELAAAPAVVVVARVRVQWHLFAFHSTK